MPGAGRRVESVDRFTPRGAACSASWYLRMVGVVLDRQNAASNLTSDEIVNTITQILLTDDQFANELERWCESRCNQFFLDDESEHLMEHWKLHEDFCNLP